MVYFSHFALCYSFYFPSFGAKSCSKALLMQMEMFSLSINRSEGFSGFQIPEAETSGGF